MLTNYSFFKTVLIGLILLPFTLFSQATLDGTWQIETAKVDFADKTRENLGVQTSIWRTLVKDKLTLNFTGLKIEGFILDDKKYVTKYQLLENNVFQLIFIDEKQGREGYTEYQYRLENNNLTLKRTDPDSSEEITFTKL
jgi:hypothetical protein